MVDWQVNWWFSNLYLITYPYAQPTNMTIFFITYPKPNLKKNDISKNFGALNKQKLIGGYEK